MSNTSNKSLHILPLSHYLLVILALSALYFNTKLFKSIK